MCNGVCNAGNRNHVTLRMGISMGSQLIENTSKINGYTMIELLVSLVIAGILLGLSLPGFQDTIERSVTNSQAKLLMTSLNLARSEAIKRGTEVGICASDDSVDCEEDAWSDGWIVFVDNNGDADGDDGSIDSGDVVIRVFDAVGSGSVLTSSFDLFQYNELGFSESAEVETLKLCPSSDNASNARSVEISISGRGRRIEGGLTCP